MTHNYENNILTLTNSDGWTLVYPYNPETQIPFGSEQEALDYAYSRPMHFIPPPTFEEIKSSAISNIASSTKHSDPVTIEGITYNGGDSSASAISGAVQLSQTLGESKVKLWDVNNVIREYTFKEAQLIAAQIAKVYRDAKYEVYQTIEELRNCSSVEELETLLDTLKKPEESNA